MKKNIIITGLVFSLSVAIDQAIKYLIRVHRGFYICNTHFAFGLNLYDIAAISAILILILIIIGPKFPNLNFKNMPALHLPVALISAGGISNIIDRLKFGCVIDFIDLKLWPVFNLADVYITAGIFIAIIKTLSNKDSQ